MLCTVDHRQDERAITCHSIITIHIIHPQTSSPSLSPSIPTDTHAHRAVGDIRLPRLLRVHIQIRVGRERAVNIVRDVAHAVVMTQDCEGGQDLGLDVVDENQVHRSVSRWVGGQRGVGADEGRDGVDVVSDGGVDFVVTWEEG